MHYTVEEIRSLRNNYLEAPYPGFSLEEITRRRRGPQTKLVRGENAWQAKGTAQTTEEWVQRLVQGSLNKMSPVNFNLIMERLKTKELFTTPEILKVVVTIVFQKALDEPENSSLYAQVCYHLATFEVSLQESGSERPNSELRNAIVAVAQEEFKDFDIDAAVGKASELCEEDQEFVRSNFMRRKRANMRFVGGLYLNGVLGSSAMLSIADATMRVKKDGHPKMEIVELLVELLTTVGERLDEQQRKHMDGLFRTLSSYREADSPYPPRIRFKLMDLIDLRNRSWKAKPTPIATTGSSTTTTTTAAANSRGKSGAAASPTTAKKSKSFADALAETNSKAAAGAWRDAKGRTGAAAPNPGAVGRFAGMQGGVSANSTNHAAAAPSAAAAKPASPPVPLGLRVVAMLESWVAECSNDFIPEWSDQFDQCEQFSDMDTFCGAVAMEAVRYACTTTRKDAQREAYSFLVVGLYLRDSEVLAGFSGALAAAIEEGLLEDVPKFSERFMHMLRLTSTEEVTSVDVYFDAANVLRMAYARMTEVDEYTVESMMGFWSKLSAPPECSGEEEAEEVEMGATVLLDLIAPAEEKEGVELLLAQVLRSLEKMAIVNAAVVEELREMEEAQTCGMCMRVLAAYDALVAKGE